MRLYEIKQKLFRLSQLVESPLTVTKSVQCSWILLLRLPGRVLHHWTLPLRLTTTKYMMKGASVELSGWLLLGGSASEIFKSSSGKWTTNFDENFHWSN